MEQNTIDRLGATIARAPKLSDPVQQSTLGDIASKIHLCADAAELALDRANNLGDRAFGIRPTEDPGTPGDKCERLEGSVDMVYSALARLDRALTNLQAAQNRLEGLA